MAIKTKSTRTPPRCQAELFAPLAGDLTPAELHAVDRVGKQAAKIRDELEAGAHQVDLSVRLTGTLVVGPSQPGGTTTETPTAASLLAVLFAGASPRSREKMLAVLKTRYEDWTAGAVQAEPELDLKERGLANDIFGSLSRQAMKAGKRGSVSGAIECKLIRRHE